MSPTAHRTIRINDDIWKPAKAKAEDEGATISDVVRRGLVDYLND